MVANLEQRKLSFIEELAELNNVSILVRIEHLLMPKVDFWDELSEKEKASIERGWLQTESGEVQDFDSFLKQIKSA